MAIASVKQDILESPDKRLFLKAGQNKKEGEDMLLAQLSRAVFSGHKW